MASLLASPAVNQIVARLNKSEAEEQAFIEKIESSCRKFDHGHKGSLTPDEYFNVLKLQNGVDITKDEVKEILSHLTPQKDGRVKIDDFLTKEITSDVAFKAMDRNKDGYITKGELKLAKKSVGKSEIDQCIKDADLDHDGKISHEEFDKAVE